MLASRELVTRWNASVRAFDPVFLNATGTVGFQGDLGGMNLTTEYLDFVGPLESMDVAARVMLPADPVPALVPALNASFTDPGLRKPASSAHDGFLLEFVPTVLGESMFIVTVTDGCTVVRTNVTLLAQASIAPDPQAANKTALIAEENGDQYVGAVDDSENVDDDDNIDVLLSQWQTDTAYTGLPVPGVQAFDAILLGSDSPTDADSDQEDIDLEWVFMDYAAGPLSPPGSNQSDRFSALLAASESFLSSGSFSAASTSRVITAEQVQEGALGAHQVALAPAELSMSAGVPSNASISVGVLPGT